MARWGIAITTPRTIACNTESIFLLDIYVLSCLMFTDGWVYTILKLSLTSMPLLVSTF